MEFKGTKGKWDYGYDGDGMRFYEISCFIDDTYENYKYDALLISKAPEMLDEINETIKDLLCIQSSVYSACKTDKKWEGVYEIIQKQIDRKKELIKQATKL